LNSATSPTKTVFIVMYDPDFYNKKIKIKIKKFQFISVSQYLKRETPSELAPAL